MLSPKWATDPLETEDLVLQLAITIAGAIFGAFAIIMGVGGFIRGHLQLSRERRLTDRAARIVGLGTSMVGLLLVGFVVFGLPSIMSRLGPPALHRPVIPQTTTLVSSPSSTSEPETTPIIKAKWKRETTADMHCSAEFPGVPTSATIELTDGRALERITLQREGGLGHYALTCMPLPDSASGLEADIIINNWRDNHLAAPTPDGGRFELIEEAKIKLDGTPGRQVDLKFSLGSEKVSMNRVFVQRGRIYRANVVIDAKRKSDDDPQRFLKSVKFR
jgi:hypothetical protein